MRQKAIIDMVGHEKEGCADKLLDDLYKVVKYLHEHRKEMDCPLEEMVKTAEELERKSKCTRQVCEEMAALSAREDLELGQMREFYKKRLGELMDIERQVPVERYEALRNDQSVVTECHLISDVDPYTKKKIRTPIRNARCGHVYDKEGVVALLQQCSNLGRTCPCAVHGCVNTDIKMADMEPYPEFFALVRLA